jgi:hypothetical protein
VTARLVIMPQIQTLERAFELARSGAVADVNQLRGKLKAEGLEVSQLQGPSLLKQIRALIAAARPHEPTDTEEEKAGSAAS